ncbi:hypothetical protein B5M47_01370 [candidate division CPR3 bacterium 4484_211]|uniref:Carboxymuconolactone decarboxylase-like domain-containing protein n=1 Tax=candidate division CPR3 bacterium 4484_211 TaxID=1968527 RepID=A0A1W9NYL6_UNCC3|nr:MAG: hypothetical protein B5M47_01370 [candidate division CPR3 bacterium 4484_211]
MASIPPLVHLVTDDEVKGQARALFEQMKKATGKVPKWMRVMANCEDVLIGFFTMFKAIMDDAPVDKLLKWRIALKISDLNKCEFCVSVAKQQLKMFGLSNEEIEDIESQSLSEKEKIALEYAIASTKHAYNIDPKIMEKMKEYYADEQIVEISSVVGLFNFINRFNDSLGVLPDQ